MHGVKSFDERVLYRAGCVASALPISIQRALSGGPVIREGSELEPELALMIRLGGRTLSPLSMPLERYRAEQAKSARIAGGEPIAVGTVRDLTVDGAEGALRARHYAPVVELHSSHPRPLLVYFHGGGFVFGDLDTHDAPCRYICRYSGVHVLAVDYRLAPEHRFPAAPLDAFAAFSWAKKHAASLGADPDRVGVGGDSAGGNLAAVVSLMAREAGEVLPACQLLVYPPVDRRSHWPSVDSFGEGFFLTKSSIDWFDEQYGMHDAEGSPDWRRNPLVASSHAGLPPTYVATAGFDPLRDEGEAYADALARAGTPVSLRRFPEQLHGFVNMVGISRTARDAVLEMAGALRVLLHQSSLALAMPSSACALSESVLGRSDCAACRRVRP